MSSLKFCRGAKEEDDSQTTEIIKLTQITQIYTDLVATREIIKLTRKAQKPQKDMVAALKIETKIKNENKIGKI